MPREKDLKRRVRARMEKTGESYTTARSHILHKNPQHPPIPPNCAELAGMSDDTVSAKTGRTWAEWVRTLDGIGAAEMQHRDIAVWVHEETGLSWWSQTVTVGYERIRGLREIGQRRGGSYEAGKSRTFKAPASVLFGAFTDAARRAEWLDGELLIRAATPHRSVRITWRDGTNIDVYLTEKSAAKTSVQIQHRGLPSRAAVAEAKSFWDDRLNALSALL